MMNQLALRMITTRKMLEGGLCAATEDSSLAEGNRHRSILYLSGEIPEGTSTADRPAASRIWFAWRYKGFFFFFSMEIPLNFSATARLHSEPCASTTPFRPPKKVSGHAATARPIPTAARCPETSPFVRRDRRVTQLQGDDVERGAGPCGCGDNDRLSLTGGGGCGLRAPAAR
jgi:hypothetical protein